MGRVFFGSASFHSFFFLIQRKKISDSCFFFLGGENCCIRLKKSSMQSIVWSSFYNHHDDHHDKVSDAFGEFVTLEQQDTIRGCMGWWDTHFSPAPIDSLASHFSDSLKDAMLIDNRSKRFHRTDFYADPTSRLHFQAMLLPIRSITPSFSNKEQGIIVSQNGGGMRRATFLPGVFPPTMPLTEILPKLVQKAGNPSDYALIGYRTRSVEWRAVDTLKKSKRYLRSLTKRCADSILGLIRRYGARGMPYILRRDATEWECDDSQFVRNLSCLRLLESYYGRAPLPQSTRYQRRINVRNDPHAMVYLSPAKVDYDALDDEFGKPQLLIALLPSMNKQVAIPWGLIERSVFAWNWWTQVIVLYRLSAYYGRLADIMRRFVPAETNEIAVLFEGSAALFTVHPPAQSVCIRSLQELGRRRSRIGFYMFKDGSCRLDITCHVLHGLIYLTR